LESYEITYIVRPDLDEEQIRGVVDGVNTRIGGGGELVATFPWNPARRRLAYPIRDFGDGFYVTTTFRFPTEGLKELERALRLNDNLLRFLVVQATDQMVQQSIQRAQQAAARAAAPPEQQAAPVPAPAPAPAPVAQAMAPAPAAAETAPQSAPDEASSAPAAAAEAETVPVAQDAQTTPVTEEAPTESHPAELEVEVETQPEPVPAATVEE
jgi:small subunit ribosomal protein S6